MFDLPTDWRQAIIPHYRDACWCKPVVFFIGDSQVSVHSVTAYPPFEIIHEAMQMAAEDADVTHYS